MTQQDTKPPPEPTRANGMPAWLFWLRAVFVVCLMPLVFLAAAAVMMIDREITAPSWIKTQIEGRADALLEGARLDFGAITVRIGRDLHPTVRLVDSQLTDAAGRVIARVPVVEGLMSPRGLILQQDVLMQEIRLVGPQVNLNRAADGDLSFALASGGADLAQARSLPELLEQFEQVFERPALEALELVEAEGLIINFDDARASRRWVVDGGAAGLDLRGGQTAIRGDFSLLSGSTVTRVNLSYQSPRGSRSAQVGLNLTDAIAADLATQSPALNWLRDIDAPLTAALRTSLDDSGALGPLNASLEIGAGQFQPNPGSPAVGFEGAKAYFTYDPVRDSISFSEVSLETEWGQLRADGDAYLREFVDGLPRALLAQFTFADVSLSPPGFYETPPQVGQLAVDVRARFDPFQVDIGQIVAIDGDSRMTASGTVAATDAGWDVALDAQIDQVTPARFAEFWPQGMKPRSREWFTTNLTGGQLYNLVAGFRSRPERAPQLALGFEFRENAIKFLRDLPPITGAAGVASIETNQMVISLHAGTVLADQGGQLDLAGSDMTVVDTRLNPSPTILNLRMDGTITATLAALNREPFRLMDRAKLPVTIADGRAQTIAQVRWPLMPRPDPDDIAVDVTAQLTSVRSETLIPNRRFAAPTLAVTATREGVNIAGSVRIGDVNAIGAWDQRFGNPDLPGSRVLAEVGLSQTFLDEFGIALPRGTISGAGKGELSIVFQEGSAPAFGLSSDLVGVRVAIPAVGWAKGANTAGNLRIQGALGPVPTIDRLEIGGGGLLAAGRINLTDAGELSAAVFDRVRIGNWLDAPITLRGRGRGSPVGVEIAGGVVDLRGARFAGGGGDSGPIKLNLSRLQVTEGIALTAFRGDFRGDGGFRGQFSGQLNGTAPINGAVAPRNGRSAVRLQSDDAGAVLRAAGFMQSALGGGFDLTLLPAGDAGTFDGRLAIRQIRVQDAPTIAAILDAISVVGLLQQMDGQGLAFDEVDATFRLTPQQVILAQASAVGPGLGISMDGSYMLATKAIDMQGVVSPFFLLNGIGSFLTRRGEGLIGFNYTIGGTTAAPDVGVNPLSVFTPGMFREIFRRPAPDISQ